MRARTHSNRVEAASHLECDADAGVEDATIERCPRIDGPAAVDGSDGPEQRAPIRLAYIREVFRIHKPPQLPDPSFNEAPKQRVGGALAPVRIVFETLSSRQIALDANPTAILVLPHSKQQGAVPRRERDVPALTTSSFKRMRIGVGRR